MDLGVEWLVAQVHLEPESRVRIAGIQSVFIVGLEQIIAGANICQCRLAANVFENLHYPAQGQALGGFIELYCAGQHR